MVVLSCFSVPFSSVSCTTPQPTRACSVRFHGRFGVTRRISSEWFADCPRDLSLSAYLGLATLLPLFPSPCASSDTHKEHQEREWCVPVLPSSARLLQSPSSLARSSLPGLLISGKGDGDLPFVAGKEADTGGEEQRAGEREDLGKAFKGSCSTRGKSYFRHRLVRGWHTDGTNTTDKTLCHFPPNQFIPTPLARLRRLSSSRLVPYRFCLADPVLMDLYSQRLAVLMFISIWL